MVDVHYVDSAGGESLRKSRAGRDKIRPMRILPTILLPLSAVFVSAAGLDFDVIRRPPLPTDPMELVMSDALPVADAQQRIAALGLLDKAHRLSNVRAQPYDLKTVFTASGGLTSDGTWQLEDIAPRGGGYRWTAQGPNYSALTLYPDSSTNGLYGNQPGGVIPLRLLQVRSAIFFVYPSVGPQASVRTASALLNGTQQSCVLIVIGAAKRTFTGGRNWEESEYCVDSQTGVLRQYSPAPGLYVRYDYSSGLRFHDKFIPTSFSIYENGRAVAEARTAGIIDPPARSDAMFDTTGLIPLGAGRAMNPGVNIAIPAVAPGQHFPISNATAAMQAVSLHGNIAGDGMLREIEILASSDPSLNQAAVNQANSVAQFRGQNQPGATMQSSELIMTVEFVTQ